LGKIFKVKIFQVERSVIFREKQKILRKWKEMEENENTNN